LREFSLNPALATPPFRVVNKATGKMASTDEGRITMVRMNWLLAEVAVLGLSGLLPLTAQAQSSDILEVGNDIFATSIRKKLQGDGGFTGNPNTHKPHSVSAITEGRALLLGQKNPSGNPHYRLGYFMEIALAADFDAKLCHSVFRLLVGQTALFEEVHENPGWYPFHSPLVLVTEPAGMGSYGGYDLQAMLISYAVMCGLAMIEDDCSTNRIIDSSLTGGCVGNLQVVRKASGPAVATSLSSPVKAVLDFGSLQSLEHIAGASSSYSSGLFYLFVSIYANSVSDTLSGTRNAVNLDVKIDDVPLVKATSLVDPYTWISFHKN